MDAGTDVRELTTEAERLEAVSILRQLWSDESPEDVLAWTGEDDYHCLGAFVDGDLVGVAGVLVRDVRHHERHAWLSDLVVDEPRRGEGHGTRSSSPSRRGAESGTARRRARLAAGSGGGPRLLREPGLRAMGVRDREEL